MRNPRLAERARTMRREATPPERSLWRILRAVPFETLHFRRQVAFGSRYITDFASHRAKVIVEADGRSHDWLEHGDIDRDAWFTGEGWRTVRLSNASILDTDHDTALELTALIFGSRG